MYKLFLDDLRAPPDGTWVVARSVLAAYEYIHEHDLPCEMSLDHDLGGELDAPKLLDMIIEDFLDGNIDKSRLLNIRFHVHSANPVGRENLEGKWMSFMSYIEGVHGDVYFGKH